MSMVVTALAYLAEGYIPSVCLDLFFCFVPVSCSFCGFFVVFLAY